MAIARVKSERVGATEVLDKIDTKKIKAGIWNPNVRFKHSYTRIPPG